MHKCKSSSTGTWSTDRIMKTETNSSSCKNSSWAHFLEKYITNCVLESSSCQQLQLCDFFSAPTLVGLISQIIIWLNLIWWPVYIFFDHVPPDYDYSTYTYLCTYNVFTTQITKCYKRFFSKKFYNSAYLQACMTQLVVLKNKKNC